MNDENKGNNNKSDKNKFQEMLQLAEFGAERLEGRRSVEFRIFISYITLLVLALYQLIKQQNSIGLELWWEGIILYGLALFMHTIYVTWQVGICIAMDNDSYRRNFYLKKAEDASGTPPKYDCENPTADRKIIIIEHYFQQFYHLKVIWRDWSRLLLVGIPTILFIIIVDLSIKKFNWDIAGYHRILLLVMPILIFVVIGGGIWIIKSSKKIVKKISNSINLLLL